jgi:Heterokaryon incompatibility protein (HET)
MAFKYTVLAENSECIHLLKILPGAKTDILRCSLSHCSRPNANVDRITKFEYAALSYTWGPLELRQINFVNGKCFPILQNLWHFLRQIRLQKVKSYLWTDAVCINQDDVTEKNPQISKMGDTYRSASTILVGLGDAADDSSVVMDLMNTSEWTCCVINGDKQWIPTELDCVELRHLDALIKLC